MGKVILLCAFFLIACGAAQIRFPYAFYHLSGNTYSGTLLGPTDKDDKPFSECSPVNGKQKCVVVFYTELNALIKDYKETKQALSDLQRKCPK